LVELEEGKKQQQLKCGFSLEESDEKEDEEDEEEEEEESRKTGEGKGREIYLYRTGNKLVVHPYLKKFGGSYFNVRIRLDKISSRKQKFECYALLKEFIAIQNRLNQLHFGNSLDKSKILPGDQVEEKTGDGLGVGYILLIVFGVLAILGGGFYAYRTFTNRGNKTRKRIKRRETAENAAAAGVSTASPEYDSDQTEIAEPGAAASLIATTNA
jgi:flagellar basal body-associated protein FliL